MMNPSKSFDMKIKLLKFDVNINKFFRFDKN